MSIYLFQVQFTEVEVSKDLRIATCFWECRAGFEIQVSPSLLPSFSPSLLPLPPSSLLLSPIIPPLAPSLLPSSLPPSSPALPPSSTHPFHSTFLLPHNLGTKRPRRHKKTTPLPPHGKSENEIFSEIKISPKRRRLGHH